MVCSLDVIHGNVGVVEQFLECEVLASGATHHADAHGKLNAVGASAVGTRNAILKALAKMVVSLHHGSKTTNSSPPMRATTSISRNVSRST